MNNRLKKLRSDARMTQDAAAEAMGVSRGQYIKLERGERRLTAEYIARAAHAFKVSQAAVIEETDRKDSIDRMLDDLPEDFAADLHDEFERRVMHTKKLIGATQQKPSR